MRIYKGIISLIGKGAWVGTSRGTRLSALEIGSATIKKIFLPDYIANYMKAGDDARILTYQGFNQKIIVAAEVGDKKYKIDRGWMFTLAFIPAVLFTLTIGSFYGIHTANTNDDFMQGFMRVFYLSCIWSVWKIYQYIKF